MCSKSLLSKILSHRRISKSINIHTYGKFICNSLCTTTATATESPDLPTWLKLAETQNDDFTLPTDPYWVLQQQQQIHKNEIKPIMKNVFAQDLDTLSKILKNKFENTDEVIKALNKCDITVTEDLVDKILKRFSNDAIVCLGFFDWARSKMGSEISPDFYNSLVDNLGKCRRFGLMWGLIEEMNKIGKGYLTILTLAKAMRRLAKAREYEDAIRVFREIERFGLRKDVEALNTLMDALVKEHSVENAQEVFLEFKDSIEPKLSTFNVLIRGLCKIREIEKAKDIISVMERHGFCPDVYTYTCFVEAYCREKDFRRVDSVLEEMERKGCKPNSVTYTIVMHSLGKAKELSKALEVYEKMKESGCVYDSSVYSSLIYILSKSGRLKDASVVFDEMPKRGVSPDSLAFNTMISAACEHSQEENALKLLKDLENSGCKPDCKTYAPLLKLFLRKQRMKVVSFLLKHMFENGISLDCGIYTLLVRGLCNNKKLDYACLYFEEMILRGFIPMDCTFEMLKKGLEREGMEKAKATIEELVLKAKSMRST